MPIRALMLDIDGVVVRAEPGRHWSLNLHKDLGLPGEALQKHFFAVHWEEIITGRADLADRLADVLQIVAPHIGAAQLLAYWFEHDSIVDHRLLRQAQEIRSPIFKVYLTSNQEHLRMRYLMDVVGLRSQVDGCFYSAALGQRKPHREFFDAIPSKLGIAPAELLLLDDSLENVAGAKAAGWSAEHWFPPKALADVLATYGIDVRPC